MSRFRLEGVTFLCRPGRRPEESTVTEGCSSRTEPDVPLESFQSIPADAARRYLEQVNLSVHGLADAVQACEELLDVLEQFLTDELGQKCSPKTQGAGPHAPRTRGQLYLSHETNRTAPCSDHLVNSHNKIVQKVEHLPQIRVNCPGSPAV